MIDVDMTQYLGIPYAHGGRDRNGIDCYGLTILFFSENYGIDCPDYTYAPDWDSNGFDYIENEYWKTFEKIESPVRHCVVTFRGFASPIERHIGIMIDDISFLHAPIKGNTCVEKTTHRVWSRQLGSYYKLKGIV